MMNGISQGLYLRRHVQTGAIKTQNQREVVRQRPVVDVFVGNKHHGLIGSKFGRLPSTIGETEEGRCRQDDLHLHALSRISRTSQTCHEFRSLASTQGGGSGKRVSSLSLGDGHPTQTEH